MNKSKNYYSNRKIRVDNLASGSSGNCYLITILKTNERFLIECGISRADLLSKLVSLDISINDIKACFISHQHKDHSLLVRDLIKWGIVIYTNKDTAFNLGLLESEYKAINNLEISIIEEVSKLSVLGVKVNHDVPNICFLFMIGKEKILFLTDYSFIGLPELQYIKDISINILISECNYDEVSIQEHLEEDNQDYDNRVIATHTGLDLLLKLLDCLNLNKCESIIITHLSDLNANENRIKTTLELAYKKQKIYIAKKQGGLE